MMMIFQAKENIIHKMERFIVATGEIIEEMDLGNGSFLMETSKNQSI